MSDIPSWTAFVVPLALGLAWLVYATCFDYERIEQRAKLRRDAILAEIRELTALDCSVNVSWDSGPARFHDRKVWV
ncbi:hypothetical protein KEM52_002666, partial [Ascosphaera acerosa]